MSRIPAEQCYCDEGIVWNNSDSTSGQYVICDQCEAGLSPNTPSVPDYDALSEWIKENKGF